jgi:hypothetical protein
MLMTHSKTFYQIHTVNCCTQAKFIVMKLFGLISTISNPMPWGTFHNLFLHTQNIMIIHMPVQQKLKNDANIHDQCGRGCDTGLGYGGQGGSEIHLLDVVLILPLILHEMTLCIKQCQGPNMVMTSNTHTQKSQF